MCPYIPQTDRKQFDEVLNKLTSIAHKGELEYCVFKLMLIYMVDKEERYSNLHDAVYATVHAAHEF